jgi:hypothetical protein
MPRVYERDVRFVCLFILVQWMCHDADLHVITLKIIVKNKYIIMPDLETKEKSRIMCSAQCCHTQKCSSINFRIYDGMCQLSREKGTCMEEEEVRIVGGYRMYQKQVI